LGQSSGSVDNINSKESRPTGTSLEATLDLLDQEPSNHISKDAVYIIYGNASNRRFGTPCASRSKPRDQRLLFLFSFPPHPGPTHTRSV
jgi:hypothetical protein